MGRNSGEVLKQCLDDMCPVGDTCNQFQQRCRAVVVDQAGSNGLAEQGIWRNRSYLWSSFVQSCGVHNVSGTHKKVFEMLTPDAVTGLIRTSLAVRQGGKFPVFRRAVLEVVKERLEVLRGEVSSEARQAREQLLSLFVGQHRNPLKSFLVLNTALNGDWRVPGRVQHYVPYGSPMPKREDIEGVIANALLIAALHHQPTIWPRHRWTGSEQAVSDIGIFLIMHSILLPIFERFSSLCGQQHRLGAAGADIEEQVVEDMGDDTAPGIALPVADNAEIVCANPAGAVGDQESHAARNSKTRSQALAWIASNPLGKVLVMKIALRPLCDLMHALLKHSGEEWEEEQRAKVASAMMSGQVPSRLSRLELAASGKLVADFYDKVTFNLAEHALWTVFPLDFCTMHWRALAFKVITKSAACIFELYSKPLQQFPMKLWRILQEPALAEQLEASPACMQDPFTQSLHRQCGGFRGPDFAAMLEACALSVGTDISQIECRHASIRRCLTSHSVQTWRMGLVMASAHWMLQNARIARQRQAKRHGTKRGDKLVKPQVPLSL